MKVKQDTKQTQAHKLLKQICYTSDVKKLSENDEVLQELLVAAKAGNVEFLIDLLRIDLDLLWHLDSNGRTIFHIAVEERHAGIFNILKELGAIKDLFVGFVTEDDGNNILHLVAKLAPQHKFNAISRAAFQMQQELIWFKVLIHKLCYEFVGIYSIFCTCFMLLAFLLIMS
jgi:hypothetical protein